ncbi:MAG TPA: arginine--tRNA ligase [Clostridiales bacterium]|mgnify:FL=1|nr:arginine--tRNA ligase [Clostridiales bacterium]
MDYKKYVVEKLATKDLAENEIRELLSVPPDLEKGDLTLPCFKLAKVLRKSPVVIANELKSVFEGDVNFSAVESVNGYLNFKFNRASFASQVLADVLSGKEKYGSSDMGKGKTICIDYSSVNIAKPFHIGHLSTTVIGGSLYKIFEFLGYKVVGINHLGDYGTQFGKMICAYKLWGNKQAVEKGGVKELMRLYVRFHEEAKQNPELDDKAREYFKNIENGCREENELFTWFKDITLKEVKKIYEKLNIKFDSYAGESFYNDKMQPVIDELTEKGLLVESDGAKVVKLDDYGMPPCIILRSDGASLYATRDLAAALYRKKTYDFYKCLYVVAYQQDLHFKQLFKVLELMGKEWAKDMVHVSFGMVSLEDGAMSTREGKVVLLEDVLNKAVEKCLNIINEKNPNLEDKENVAEIVGIGAVIFGTLFSGRIKDITFSYDKMLNFDGETGPYVQYTCARCKSVLRKSGEIKDYKVTSVNDDEYALTTLLARFPEIVKQSAEKYEPSIITRYSVDLAEAYNKFYFDYRILGEEDDVKNYRLALTSATLYVLSSALRLLGISVPEKM